MATSEQINMRKAVLAYLKANPDKHEQASWIGDASFSENDARELREGSCGTTMCVAGTAVFLNALENEQYQIYITGETEWINKASNILGLEYDDAYNLFMAMNNETVLEELEQLSLEEPS